MPRKEHHEIECRFLEIDKEALISKLRSLGAKDLREVMLEETILYSKEDAHSIGKFFVRIRKDGKKVKLSYKEHQAHTVDGSFEIELEISDGDKAILMLEKLGLAVVRHQQKKRHTFILGDVTCDIDTWPRLPTYVELEAESEEALQKAAEKIGYDWKDADFHNAAWIIEEKYHIPVRKMKYFTFERFE